MTGRAVTAAPYETWSKDALSRWTPAAFPDGAGGTWTWAEPDARLVLGGGRAKLEVPRFTRSHDVVQIFDNPKHLLACKDPIPVPDGGVRIEVEMAAGMHASDGADWSDGFASFNLMDFEHGLVLDGLANGRRTGALFERLHIPGVIDHQQSFTAIADGPGSTPETRHTFRFDYDPSERRIHAWIDGRPVLEWRNVPERIRSFTPGFGLITLRPIRDGRSTSLRGQGAWGELGTIRVARLP